MPTNHPAVIALALLVAAAGCLEVAPGAGEENVNPGAVTLPEDVAALFTGTPCVAELPQPSFHADAQVEEWTGDVPPNVTRGALDVQSFDGGVLIVPWNQSGYRVEVGEVDQDDRLTPAVDAAVEDGVFRLTVRVDDAGPDGGELVRFNEQRPVAQVMVWVPSLHFEAVDVTDYPENDRTYGFHLGIQTTTAPENVWRSFVTGDLRGDAMKAHFLNLDVTAARLDFQELNATTLDGDVAIHSAVGDAFRASSHDGDVCASAVDAASVKATSLDGDIALRGVAADTTKASTHDGDVSVADVRGDALKATSLDGDVAAANATVAEAKLRSHDGDVVADGVDATNLTLSSIDGDVIANNATAPTLRASSHSGDVAVADTRVARLNASSIDGDVVADVTPAATGWARLGSHDGDVVLRVPTGDAYGYNATAATHEGTASVNLTGAEVVSRADDGSRVHARTAGFDGRAIQWQVKATSLSGNVVVTDA